MAVPLYILPTPSHTLTLKKDNAQIGLTYCMASLTLNYPISILPQVMHCSLGHLLNLNT